MHIISPEKTSSHNSASHFQLNKSTNVSENVLHYWTQQTKDRGRHAEHRASLGTRFREHLPSLRGAYAALGRQVKLLTPIWVPGHFKISEVPRNSSDTAQVPSVSSAKASEPLHTAIPQGTTHTAFSFFF